MEEEKRYSTIRMSSHKAHVYDHKTRCTICGTNHWDWKPFKINKTLYGITDMLKRHMGFAERRGYPNPYKYTCIKCEDKLKKLKEKEN